MFRKELKESLRRKKLFTAVIIASVTLFFIAVTFLSITHSYIEMKKENVSTFKGATTYELLDTLQGEEEEAFLQKQDSLEKLKSLYTYLEEGLNEEYVVSQDHPVEIAPTFAVNEIFAQGYEYGNPQEPFQFEDRTYYNVKAIQLNEQAFKKFPLTVSEGEPFSTTDFQMQESGQEIPVLLGADYKGTYEVGDVIDALYLVSPHRLEVKGFLEPNIFVSTQMDEETYVDRYIVMVAGQYGVPTNEEEHDFQMRQYLQLINGTVYTSADLQVVQEKIEQAKRVSDFPHLTIMGTIGESVLTNLFDTIEEQLNLVIAISIMLFVGCIISIAALTIKKINTNYKNMMVHLISGGTMAQLLRNIFIEVVVLVAIPATLVTIPFVIFMAAQPLVLVYITIVLVCVCAVIIGSFMPIALQFRKLSISEILKREE